MIAITLFRYRNAKRYVCEYSFSVDSILMNFGRKITEIFAC
nr:MAG TPA: hypothetical protein [Caudoviricetes sp.]